MKAPTPTQLTDEQIDEAYDAARSAFKSHMSKVRGQQVMPSDGFDWHFARSIEAVRDQQWQEMLAKQEPVLYVDPNTLEMAAAHVGAWKPGHELPHNIPLYRKPNDHTAVMRQALEALDCLEAPPTGAINHYELERRKNALRAVLAQPDVQTAVGNSGFDHKTAADFLSGKDVTGESVRQFVAASRWAHDDRASLRALVVTLRQDMAAKDAEIALIKQALLNAEAAAPKGGA